MDTFSEVFVKQTFSGVPLARVKDDQNESFAPINVNEENGVLARGLHKVLIYHLDRTSSSYTNSSIGAPVSSYGFGMSSTDAEFYRYDIQDSTDIQFLPTNLVTTRDQRDVDLSSLNSASLDDLQQSLVSPGSLDTDISTRTRADLDLKFLMEKTSKQSKDCVVVSSVVNGSLEMAQTTDNSLNFHERSAARVENGKEYWTRKFWSFEGITSVVSSAPQFYVSEWGPRVHTYGRIILAGVRGSQDSLVILGESRHSEIDYFKPQMLANIKMFMLAQFQRLYRCALEAAVVADILQDHSKVGLLREMQVLPQVYQQLSLVNAAKFSPEMLCSGEKYTVLVLGTGGMLLFFTIPFGEYVESNVYNHTSPLQCSDLDVSSTAAGRVLEKDLGGAQLFGKSVCIDEIENIHAIHNIPGLRYAGSIMLCNLFEQDDCSVHSDAIGVELLRDRVEAMHLVDYSCACIDVSSSTDGNVLLSVTTTLGDVAVLNMSLSHSNMVKLDYVQTKNELYSVFQPLLSLSLQSLLTYTKLLTVATGDYVMFIQQDRCFLFSLLDQNHIFIQTHSNVLSISLHLETLLLSHTDGTTSRYQCTLSTDGQLVIGAMPVLRHDTRDCQVLPNVISSISTLKPTDIAGIRKLQGSGVFNRGAYSLLRQYAIHSVEGNLVQWSAAVLHEEENMVHNDWYVINNVKHALTTDMEKPVDVDVLAVDNTSKKYAGIWLLHQDILTVKDDLDHELPALLKMMDSHLSSDLKVVLKHLYTSLVGMKTQYTRPNCMFHVPLHRALNQLVATTVLEYVIFLNCEGKTALYGSELSSCGPFGSISFPGLGELDEVVLTRVNVKVALLLAMCVLALAQDLIDPTANEGLFCASPVLNDVLQEARLGCTVKTSSIRQHCAFLRALTTFILSLLHPDLFTLTSLRVNSTSLQPKHQKGTITSTEVAVDAVKSKLSEARGETQPVNLEILNYLTRACASKPVSTYSLHSESVLPRTTLLTTIQLALISVQQITTQISDAYMTLHTLSPQLFIYPDTVKLHATVPLSSNILEVIPLLQACDRTLLNATNAWSVIQNTAVAQKIDQKHLMLSYYSSGLSFVKSKLNNNNNVYSVVSVIPSLVNFTSTAFQAAFYTTLLSNVKSIYSKISSSPPPTLQYLGMYKYHHIHDPAFSLEHRLLDHLQYALERFASQEYHQSYAATTKSSCNLRHGFQSVMHEAPLLQLARYITVNTHSNQSLFHATSLIQINPYIHHYTLPNSDNGIDITPNTAISANQYAIHPTVSPVSSVSKCNESSSTFDHLHTGYAVQAYPYITKQLQCTCCRRYLNTTIQTTLDRVIQPKQECNVTDKQYMVLCNASTVCPYCLTLAK